MQRFTAYPGCAYLGGQQIETVTWDGIGAVSTRVAGGRVIVGEKVLCALGRVPNLEALASPRRGCARTRAASSTSTATVVPQYRTSTPPAT